MAPAENVPVLEDNSSRESAYRRALSLLLRDDAIDVVKDDTYAEKFVTQTARHLDKDPQFWTRGGLAELVTEDKLKKRSGFAAHLLRACAEVDERALDMADKFCKTASAESSSAVAFTNGQALELLKLVAGRRPAIEADYRLLESVIIPIWRGDVIADCSNMFYKKSLREVTVELLVAGFKSGDGNNTAEHVARLCHANLREANLVVHEFLKRLLNEEVIPGRDLDFEGFEESLTPDTRLLLYSIVNTDKAGQLLSHIDDPPDRRILGACNILRDSNRFQVVQPFIRVCLDVVSEERNHSNGFAATILNSKLLTKSPELPEVLIRLLGRITSWVEQQEITLAIGVLQSADDVIDKLSLSRAWPVLTDQVTILPMGEAGIKVNLVKIMKRLLAGGIQDSNLTFDAAFERLWLLWNPSLGWELTDSFLELVAAGLTAFDTSALAPETANRVASAAKAALESRDTYVRSSSFVVYRALSSCKVMAVGDSLESTVVRAGLDSQEQEAIVRRQAAAFFVSHFRGRHSEVPDDLLPLMCEAMRDLGRCLYDWETREVALDYWKAVAEEGGRGDPSAYAAYLDRTHCTRAFMNATEVTEVRFRSRHLAVLREVRGRLSTIPEGCALSKVFASFDFNADPEELVDEFCEVHDGLWSVVDDINQSAAGQGQLDGIDCV